MTGIGTRADWPAENSDRMPRQAGAVSLRQALPVWLKIAALSFGGPAGQIAVMHRVVVDERGWVSEPRFLHALNFCMLVPGPEAQQLATYLGWMMHGVRGGLVAGGLFVLPGAIAILALSYVYVLFGDVGVVAALFFGLKAAVVAIVIEALLRIGRRALKERWLVALAAASFVAIFAFDVAFPVVVLAAALAGFGMGRMTRDRRAAADALDEIRPARLGSLAAIAGIGILLWWAPVIVAALALGPGNVLSEIGLFFSKTAIITFGGAYSILSYVGDYAVETAGWLTAGQMLDGLGLAETTPGPLIMVLQFVGFLAAFGEPGAMSPLAAGTLGGLLATWVTFAPSFLFVLLGAPFVERLRAYPGLAAALRGITAAVVGVILNLALWFGLHFAFRETQTLEGPLGLRLDYPNVGTIDWTAAGLIALAVILVFRLKVGMLWSIAATSALGIALFVLGWGPSEGLPL